MLNHLLFKCLDVIKLAYSLRLKIKRNDCVARVPKQPIIVLYFESENELKFYNLEAIYRRGFSQIFTIKDVNLSLT